MQKKELQVKKFVSQIIQTRVFEQNNVDSLKDLLAGAIQFFFNKETVYK